MFDSVSVSVFIAFIKNTKSLWSYDTLLSFVYIYYDIITVWSDGPNFCQKLGRSAERSDFVSLKFILSLCVQNLAHSECLHFM